MTPDASALLALVVSAVGIVVVSVVRVVLHARRTGSVAVRLAAGRAGIWVGVLSSAGFSLAVVAPALVLADTMTPLRVPPITSWIGLGLMLFGFGAVVGSQSAMGASWRVGVDPRRHTDLVITGVFGLVRNPIYSGMIVAFCGMALMVPTAVAVAAVALLVAAVEVQVRFVEEPHLLKAHGTAYRSYAVHTGRFVPGLGRLREPTARETP